MKRPIGWRIDDALGTRPLFDLLLGGPGRHSWREWMAGIVETVRVQGTQRARAYRRWHRAYRRSIIWKDDQELKSLSDEYKRRQQLPDRVAAHAHLSELYTRVNGTTR